MTKPILTVPENSLRQKSQEVASFDKSLESLITDLGDTLVSQTDPVGLGLSAVQIGVLKRVFVARVKNRIKTFCKPENIKIIQKRSYLSGGLFFCTGYLWPCNKSRRN